MRAPASNANCPAPSPCLCTPGIINCEGKGLTSVPTYRSSTSTKFHTLLLANNNISVIPPNAFVGLSSVNVSTIRLDRNNINVIAQSAFQGIQDNVLDISLSDNLITSLPMAFSSLSKLKSLDVAGNPIPGFTGSGRHGHGSDGLTNIVMTNIGDTLTSFRFGSRTALQTWPHSLKHLIQLQELTVSGSAVAYFPANAFYGFEHTLRKLTIEYASLARVPIGINSLTRLDELHLDNLEYPFDDSSMIAAPFTRIANTLKVLSLKNDSLTVFPEAIQQLNSLKSLILDGNNLEFVSDEAIKLLKSSNVTSLSLQNCNLKRVPGAISDLINLLSLKLDGNYIRSLESTDLHNLNHLRTLTVSQNPLKYISDNALCGLNQLINFDLVNTSLTEVSKSFQNLKKLRRLDLTDSKIDCTCDVTWMNKWRAQCQHSGQVEIMGQCETINMEIEKYIDDRLLSCPDFIRGNFTCGTTSCRP